MRFLLLYVMSFTFLMTTIGNTDEKPPSTDSRKPVTSKSTGMKLAPIAAGTFLMGASDEDLKRLLAKDARLKALTSTWVPQHQVEVSPFYMGIYEVTQADYKKVMGKNPSATFFGGGKESPQSPVDNVSWFDAIEFCNKLSQKDGLTPRYSLKTPKRREGGSIESATVSIINGTGYRLPTEAEWEYACRAGTTTAFNTGEMLTEENTGFTGKQKRPDAKAVKVGSYKPNHFGLYDMHGNNAEFCFDVYVENAYSEPSASTKDPVNTKGSESRVVRGGNFESEPWQTYSFSRQSMMPGQPWGGVGFRIVKN